MRYDIKNLKIGDEIILKDEVTLKDLLNEGKGIKGAQETITNIREFKAQNNIFKFIVYTLEGDYQRFLVLKVVDDKMDIRIYMYNGWLNPGTKADLVEAGHQFLFAPPTNPDRYNSDSLAFTFDFRLDDNFYEQKYSTIFGEVFETPKKTGVTYPMFGCLKEYIFSAEGQKVEEFPDCKEVLLLESNGWVEFLEGYGIDISDIEVFSGKH